MFAGILGCGLVETAARTAWKDYAVTAKGGDAPDPDCTGTYSFIGLKAGVPKFSTANAAYILFGYPVIASPTQWKIRDADASPVAGWSKTESIGTPSLGEYAVDAGLVGNTASGTAVVAEA